MAVERGDRDRVAEAEAVELERLVVSRGVVDLVHEHQNRLSGAPEDLGHLLVAGGDTALRVNDEEDEIGFLHRATRLLDDRTGDRRRIDDVDAARVHEDESLAIPFADDLLAVARHARRLENHGLPGGREAVHKR